VLASVTVETVRGALAYQAPEVLARRVLSPAADCYAFGVLLWEMLTAQARPGCCGSHARLAWNAAGARRKHQW
jgi:serine/threonine protein kinase